MSQCREITETALQMQSAQEIDSFLKEELKKLAGNCPGGTIVC
jgi:hypothetical protein